MQFRKMTPVHFRGAYPPHFYKRGLRDEIVRGHYDVAMVSGNIKYVCSGVHIGWACRVDVPRRGLGPAEKHYYI